MQKLKCIESEKPVSSCQLRSFGLCHCMFTELKTCEPKDQDCGILSFVAGRVREFQFSWTAREMGK